MNALHALAISGRGMREQGAARNAMLAVTLAGQDEGSPEGDYILEQDIVWLTT